MAGQTPVPVSTGALYRDNFSIQYDNGTFENSLTDVDFTKALSNATTGGASTAGIVITKVSGDVTGKYDVLIPATVFAANGFYTLTVFVTAEPTQSFTQEYVASPGGGGSTGVLTFDAVLNNGRVVDEFNTPVSAATVYLSQGSVTYAFITDANGDWGTFYSDPMSGTWNITVLKSGFTQGNATLNVGAVSITGPGANITMETVLSASSIVAAELWSYARRMAFNKAGPQADIKITQLVNDAIDRIARDTDSNWYQRRGYIQLNAATTQGVDLTNGSMIATLPSGAWPAWAGNGRLFVNNLIVDVAERVDDTTLTLTAPWGGITGSTQSVLFQNSYDLPLNFLTFGNILEGQNWPYKPVPISIQVLWQWENALVIGTQYANAFGIQFGKLWMWPYPTVSQSIAYTFKARPLPLADETDLADVDPTWIEVIHKCIDHHVAIYFGDCVAGNAKETLNRYVEAVSLLPTNDKLPAKNGPVTGGYAQNIPFWRSKAL